MEEKQLRNFCIISHIDHGKSTLADCFLKLTGTISADKMKPQFLDTMDLEREKGITIKLQPVRLEIDFEKSDLKIENYLSCEKLKILLRDKLKIPNSKFILNLVDTPGHVDFSYEVSRALVAVEGAILLVDATKGIQAQTLANLELAQKQNLVIIPVINKIDLPQAETEKVAEEIANLLKIKPKEVLKISAKEGTNVEKVLEAIIEKIPSPNQEREKDRRGTGEESFFKALIFDSEYDPYKGVIAYVRVVSGKVVKGDKIWLMASKTKAEALEVGYFNPDFSPQKEISNGEIGYIATGIKESEKIRVGDTITLEKDSAKVQPLPGYQEPKPMIFASFYPENSDNFNLLKEGLEKLKLNDPSFSFEIETKKGLGRGFRCGFLGSLHAEIISERLKREFGLDLVISKPSVVYRIIDKQGKEKMIYSPADWPDDPRSTEEPWVLLEIVSPLRFIGLLSEILKKLRGNYLETKYLSSERVVLSYEIPLREIVVNLYDKIKSASQGYASMNYRFLGYRPEKLKKMDILIAGKKEEAFSKIVPEKQAYQEGKILVEKLKEVLPIQQFSVALQAVINNKVIARETIKSRRKDVTGYLYGGDYSRKKKLLEKQKKGKKILKEKGQVRIPTKVFLEVFKS